LLLRVKLREDILSNWNLALIPEPQPWLQKRHSLPKQSVNYLISGLKKK